MLHDVPELHSKIHRSPNLIEALKLWSVGIGKASPELESLLQNVSLENVSLDCLCSCEQVKGCIARPTLSQLWSFKISHTTLLNYTKWSDLLILRLCNCERAGRASSLVFSFRDGLAEIPLIERALADWTHIS